MAARKPPAKKKAAGKKASVLGNDPFARGSAVREVSARAPAEPPKREAARPVTPELLEGRKPVAPVRQAAEQKRPVLSPIGEKPKSGSGAPQPPPRFVPPAPAVTPVRPHPRGEVKPKPPAASPRVIVTTARASAPAFSFDAAAPTGQASPSLTVDPRPHPGAPTAQTLSGPTSHFASPSLSVDPRPHAGAPTARTLSGPMAHAASPSIAVDPRPHAGAPTAQTLSGPTSHAASPSIAVDPRPHAGAPTARTLSGPTSHAASPSFGVDPRPHAGTPSAQVLVGPTSHATSPSIAVDPRPHAGAPTARPLSGPMSHAASPSITVDPRPHAGAPTAQVLSGPASHSASPSLTVDPRPHAGTPTAQVLSGPTSHSASPSLAVDPRPHAGTPTAQTASPLAPTLSPAGERGLAAPTVTDALKGLLNAARSSAGLASRSTEVDRWGKDAALASSLRPLAELLYDKYWRVRVEGAAHLPAGPCIIVANHAGALPLDGPVLHLALRRERPDLEESRWLLEDQIFHAPFVGVLANRLGAVRASPENALRLLEENRPLIVFPEGFHGLSKPFSERYQLKRFGRGGYVKIALRAGVPIIPAAIIGGEESMPLLGKLPGGLFGVQYLPVTLPPLPARWHIRFAAPVPMENAPAQPDSDLAWIERKNLAVRDQIEAMLTDMLQHRERIF